MDNEPTVPAKQNGNGGAPVGMSKGLLAKSVTFKDLRAIFEATVLPLQARIAELERACGLVPSPKPGVEAIAPVVANHINARLAPLEHTVNELDNECMRYADIYTPGKTYRRGQVCTHDGAWWLAREATDSRPGTGDSGWVMTVKSYTPRSDRK